MAIAVWYETLLALLVFSCLQIAPTFTCREDEWKALLQFKAGLIDYSGRLSSWVGQDCCSWWGVVCSNQTGHVIQLRIPSPRYGMMEGDEINPSLLALSQLSYLDPRIHGFIPKTAAPRSVMDKYGWKSSSGIGSTLGALNLDNNSFSGGIPLALQKCTQLVLLDLGSNKFNGSIPTWIGEKFTNLEVLILRSNMLVEKIPIELGNLSSLRVINLSQNMLCGTIPQSFANSSAMKYDYPYGFFGVSNVKVDINMKGRVYGYKLDIYFLPKSMDLSSNNLSGEIPEALMALDGLQNLNLSRNHLVGTLTTNITKLQYLESLDLSFNNFTGEIPSTMTNLHFLSIMNFSFNDLSGRIPTGGQFDSHPDPSIYMGNANLCGFPLDSTCGGYAADPPSRAYNNKEARENEEIWFYVSAALGFVLGFWALIGTLLLNRKWRIAYNRKIDRACDNIFVFVSLNHAKIVHSSKQVVS